MATKKRGKRPAPPSQGNRRLVGSSAPASPAAQTAADRTAGARTTAARTTAAAPRHASPGAAPAPVAEPVAVLGRSSVRRGWIDPDWLSPPPRARFAAGWALLPLRAFLGFTFVFAGLQKLANPEFFNASNPASIQAQMAGAALRSPIHSLISPLTHVAVPLGILIALGEIAVGLGALLGLWTRVAAVGGVLISFMLFLTVSYHSSPYYTGSDIVFVFAWTPLVVAGAGGVLSADAILENRVRDQMDAERVAVVPIPFSAVRRVCGFYEHGACGARNGAPCAPAPCPYLIQRPSEVRRLGRSEVDRRTVVVKGAATAALSAVALAGAGLVAGLGRLAGGATTTKTPTLGGTGGASAPPASSGHAVETTTTTGAVSQPLPAHPPGTKIGAASQVPVGGAAAFTDPTSQDPSLVVQPHQGTFLAFDAVCPHAGCTVQYDNASKLFVCPCHGSEFNGITGAVEVGPAQTGLTRLTVAEGSDGQLYVA
jgi:thiosulfate dehydrogenase (quinone) large subunit